MQILLDSRDLIDLAEHSRPVTVNDFDIYLRKTGHQNVLSMTNVRELASPLSSGTEFLEIRPLLQSLERIPHTYIKEVTIVACEIQAAVQAFESGSEYQDCCVYVTRWDHTLVTPPGQQPATENWVNFRLDEIIYHIHRVMPRLFAPPNEYLATLHQLFQQDRDALRALRAPAQEHFICSIKRHAASHGVQLPAGREDNVARWVYQKPKSMSRASSRSRNIQGPHFELRRHSGSRRLLRLSARVCSSLR